MDFVNETKLSAAWTLGFEPDGRELLVVAAKGTFTFAQDTQETVLSETQLPLTMADEFTGEPGRSATLYETDFAHRKPLCDVLLNGSAYAPGGKPHRRVRVSLQVGGMTKAFDVVGERVWRRRLLFMATSNPVPFTRLPISYDKAYGGVDTDARKTERQDTCLANPIGIGHYPLSSRSARVGKPLPNTEAVGQRVKAAKGKYVPMAFGPVSRNAAERVQHAGTYDEKWLSTRAPCWPADFDYRYFQAAPADQQMPHPDGGEEVVLRNLTPAGLTSFRLPTMTVPILYIRHRGGPLQVNAVLDTIVMEPDESRLMLTWRSSLPLRRNCFELEQVVVGGRPASWLAARRAEAAGKRYYPGLGALVADRGRRR